MHFAGDSARLIVSPLIQLVRAILCLSSGSSSGGFDADERVSAASATSYASEVRVHAYIVLMLECGV
jgi:hypothetical protein